RIARCICATVLAQQAPQHQDGCSVLQCLLPATRLTTNLPDVAHDPSNSDQGYRIRLSFVPPFGQKTQCRTGTICRYATIWCIPVPDRRQDHGTALVAISPRHHMGRLTKSFGRSVARVRISSSVTRTKY